jgi:transposase-like protein
MMSKRKRHSDLTRKLALSLTMKVGIDQASRTLGIPKAQLRRWSHKVEA